jgi:hypothetical protein
MILRHAVAFPSMALPFQAGRKGEMNDLDAFLEKDTPIPKGKASLSLSNRVLTVFS